MKFNIREGKTLRELLPDLTEEEFIEAEKNFEDFVELAWKVYKMHNNIKKKTP